MSATFTIEISKIRAVSLAMAEQDIRYYLCGILIEHNGAETRLVGCDGHRLHAVRVEYKDRQISTPVSVIMPATMVKTIIKAKALRGSREPAQVIITIDGIKISARLPDGTETVATAVDGAFPDYRRVLPKNTASMEPASYQPDYVKDAITAYNLHVGNKTDNYVSVALAQNGDRVGFLTAPGFIAAVMPLRRPDVFVNPGDEFFPMLQASALL